MPLGDSTQAGADLDDYPEGQAGAMRLRTRTRDTHHVPLASPAGVPIATLTLTNDSRGYARFSRGPAGTSLWVSPAAATARNGWSIHGALQRS